MNKKSQQTKGEHRRQRMELGKTLGLMAAGIAGGVYLPGRVAAPLGLVLSGLAFAGKPKPMLLAVGLPMLGGVATDLNATGGAGFRRAENEKFSIKNELAKGGLRGRAYLSALGDSLWLDKIFKKKQDVDLAPVLAEGDSGVDLNGFDPLAELDRIDTRSISERTMEFRGGVDDF